MPVVNLGDIITTTLRSRTGQLADNVTSNNALLTRLNTKGRIKPVTGGSQILQELAYANNGTAMFYSGYQPLDITPQKVIDAATFDIKQAAVGISISGLEMLKNSGKEQIIDLLEARIEVAEETMKNLISTGIYSDGTGFGGTQIGGLQLLVSTTPTTGTVGGFDRSNSSNSFWRNQSTTFSGLSLTAGSDTIQAAMNNLYLKCVRGSDAVDLIVADNTYYRYYLESLQALYRITDTNSDVGKLGYQSLKYMNADVVLDGGMYTGSYTGVPSSQMYFLNTKYIHFRPHADRNMVVDERPRISVNQDAEARLILFAGNMTLSNAMLQGVLSAS
jgi:hypothetical protein